MGPARESAGNYCGKQRQGNLDEELRAGIRWAFIRKKSQEVFAVPMIRDPCARTTELYDAAIAAESIRSGKEGSSTSFQASLRDRRPTRNTQPITISSFTEPSNLEKARTRGASVKLSRRRGGGIASGRCVPSFACLVVTRPVSRIASLGMSLRVWVFKSSA